LLPVDALTGALRIAGAGGGIGGGGAADIVCRARSSENEIQIEFGFINHLFLS
jgi:hypothetical protein